MELEKASAPITEQIQHASLFAEFSLSNLQASSLSNEATEVESAPSQASAHGRREYVLRWVLKKFQEDETRRCHTAWRLLRLLLDYMPLRNAAKILNEKKFVFILRQAIEEAVVALNQVEDSSDTVTASPVIGAVRSATSKKRKRDGRWSSDMVVDHSPAEGNDGTAGLKVVVYEAIDRIVQLSMPESPSSQAFLSEYVKSAIRTSSVEAARILGAWLALSGNQTRSYPLALEQRESLLSPFLEIWDSRIPDPEDAKIFSEHCLTPSLKQLSMSGQLPELEYQLEKLLARSIMVPARTAYGFSKNANLLWSLVGDSVSRNSKFVPIIFSIAIRCILPQGSRPRRPDDTAWLQAVLKVLIEAISGDVSQDKVNAVDQMLLYCIDEKVTLELPFLRLITSQYGLKDGNTSWGLLATIIKLDSNTFLVPSKSCDLLKNMLLRITKASSEAAWPTIVDQVVDDVLVPLMGEFAKARQLTAFIHHWYEQLAEFGNIQQPKDRDINHFSAWEDEALRSKLRELLEPSLTTLQIVEIVEWLEEKIKDGKGSAYVLVDAIATAVSSEETMIALQLKLYSLAANVQSQNSSYEGYKARLLHLNTVMLHWSYLQRREDTSAFGDDLPSLINLLANDHLIPKGDHSLEALEVFRYLCAGWSNGVTGFRSESGVKTLSRYIANVRSLVERVVKSIAEDLPLGEEQWGSRVTTTARGIGWLTCAHASCILVEYPRVLEYVWH
jgi:nucleolar pre-ribosomal-associated protein 2